MRPAEHSLAVRAEPAKCAEHTPRQKISAVATAAALVLPLAGLRVGPPETPRDRRPNRKRLPPPSARKCGRTPRADARVFRLPTGPRKSPTRPASTTIAAISGPAAGSGRPMKTTFERSSRHERLRSPQPPYPKSTARLPALRRASDTAPPKRSTKPPTATPTRSKRLLLIPEVRKKIEAALGKRLSDEQLRALVDHNRAEAVYWYGYLQSLRSTREPAEQ